MNRRRFLAALAAAASAMSAATFALPATVASTLNLNLTGRDALDFDSTAAST